MDGVQSKNCKLFFFLLVFQGDILPTIKQAKRSAAMKACIKLYENGELTQQLLPFSKQKKIESVEPIYFKHWDKYAGGNLN